LAAFFVVSTKCIDSLLLEFVGSNNTGNIQCENCISLDFNFRRLSGPSSSSVVNKFAYKFSLIYEAIGCITYLLSPCYASWHIGQGQISSTLLCCWLFFLLCPRCILFPLFHCRFKQYRQHSMGKLYFVRF
jgi:hypothetical protein